MAVPEITPRAIFSLRHQVKQNAHYISDFQIIYPAGSVLVTHNYVEKRQRYIKLFDKSVYLEMICVSPSRKYAAIIQNSEKGHIVIFDLQTLKKKRVLNLPHESTTTRFETFSFTHDDLYIVAITGEPDWNMVVYNWAKGKVTSMTRAVNVGSNATVTQVCCSPTSSTDVCLIGSGLFRLMTLSETVWRQYGFQKVDQLNVTAGAWVTSETIVCGTSDGKVFFIDNGELKGVYNAFTALTLTVKDKDEYSIPVLEGILGWILQNYSPSPPNPSYQYQYRLLKSVFFARSDTTTEIPNNLFLVHRKMCYVMLVKCENSMFQQIASSSLLGFKTGSNEVTNEDMAVRALIAFPKGFAYSCGVGHVHVFERDKNKYKKRNVFVIDDPIVSDLHSSQINIVNHLSINVSQDKLLATTNRAQLYMVRLWGPDLNVAAKIPFRHLGEPLHNGSINGLSLCVWKPIFATSGKSDRTIQIWNFETESVQIVKRFKENLYCIDLHPMGTFIAIGFADRLEISLILMNDIQSGRSIPFRNCNICMFSFHGNFIAAVSENVVEVYSSVMYNNIYTFQGHIGTINRVRWSVDNKRLVTCGTDGLILFWDLINGELAGEVSTPGVSYLDIVLSLDGKFTYAVGDDGLIKEIAETNIVKTVGLNQSVINNITITRSNFLMFISAGTSDVMSVKMPLTDPPDYTLYPFHSTKVTQIRLSFDDLTLVTVSDGGSIILWKLNLAEDKTVAVDKNFMYSTEVLINKAQLEQHILMMKDLSQKLYEMEMAQAREMRDTENNYGDRIREMHEKFAAIIEELKEKVEETETSQRNQLLSITDEIKELKESQEREKKQMIENYTAKLSVEYEKVRRLDALKEETVQNFDEMVADLVRSEEEETNDIIRTYEKKLLDVENELKASHEENVKNVEEHEIDKQYIEDDADRELVETKAKYEQILKEEKEQNVVYKDEAVHMRKKFAEAHKERIEFRGKLELLQIQQQKLQSTIHSLEKDVTDLKREIVERDSALKEKDERILILKKRIQELEKYKFVLDYKIKELKNQIDPKDREIRERKEEIVDMEMELANLKKMNTSLELQVSELKEKINGTEKQVSTFEKMHKSTKGTLKQMKIDIYSIYQDIQDHKLVKDGVMKLYHKYHQDDLGLVKDQYGDTDSQRDFLIQREFLEKTIRALKSTLSKSQQNKSDRRKVLKNNVVLLEELNHIREELKQTTITVRNLERLIGVRQSNQSIAPSEAYKKIMAALKKHDEIKGTYEKVILSADKQTASLHQGVKQQEDKLIALLHESKNN